MNALSFLDFNHYWSKRVAGDAVLLWETLWIVSKLFVFDTFSREWFHCGINCYSSGKLCKIIIAVFKVDSTIWYILKNSFQVSEVLSVKILHCRHDKRIEPRNSRTTERGPVRNQTIWFEFICLNPVHPVLTSVTMGNTSARFVRQTLLRAGLAGRPRV